MFSYNGCINVVAEPLKIMPLSHLPIINIVVAFGYKFMSLFSCFVINRAFLGINSYFLGKTFNLGK